MINSGDEQEPENIYDIYQSDEDDTRSNILSHSIQSTNSSASSDSETDKKNRNAKGEPLEEDGWELLTPDESLTKNLVRPKYKKKAEYVPPNKRDGPFDIFLKMFPYDLFVHMANETNIYATNFLKSQQISKSSRANNWKETNPEEIKLFLGLQMLMGIIKLPAWRDYWMEKNYTLQTNMPKFMKFYRYDLLNKFFQIHTSVGNESRNAFTANKVKFFDKITANYAKLVVPNENLSVDERLCRFRGRFSAKVYMPLKPDKWGVKCIVLCDSNGYALKVHISVKSITSAQLDELVLEMLEDYYHLNHKLHMDNYYTHVGLLLALEKVGIWGTGTVKVNRKDNPIMIKRANPEKDKAILFARNNLIAYKGRNFSKHFLVMSTYDNFIIESGERKPNLIKNYNTHMKGVDILNQYSAYYRYPFKSKKWWKAIFYSIMEASIVNSFIIYKKYLHNKMEYKQFKLIIAESMIKDTLQSIEEIRSSCNNGYHFPAHLEKTTSKPCRVCQFYGKYKKSGYKCIECSRSKGKEMVLCVTPCFEIFHRNTQKFLVRRPMMPKKSSINTFVDSIMSTADMDLKSCDLNLSLDTHSFAKQPWDIRPPWDMTRPWEMKSPWNRLLPYTKEENQSKFDEMCQVKEEEFETKIEFFDTRMEEEQLEVHLCDEELENI